MHGASTNFGHGSFGSEEGPIVLCLAYPRDRRENAGSSSGPGKVLFAAVCDTGCGHHIQPQALQEGCATMHHVTRD